MSAGPEPSLVVFFVFVGLCGFLWVITIADQDDAAMFPAGQGSSRPWLNGLVISGECLSAVTLTALVGLVAFTGYDGMMIPLGSLTGLALLTTLLAVPLRRAGRHTLGDALTHRMPERSVRAALGITTFLVCLPYLVLQLTAMGSLTSFILGVSSSAAKATCIVVLGVLVASVAISGGMRGTAHVQIVKVVLLFAAMTAVSLMVLHRFDWNPERLLSAAASGSGLGDAFLSPGVQYGSETAGTLNRLGQFLTMALAMASLPQITMRVLAAPRGRAVRSSMHWAIVQFVAVSLLLVTIGVGTAAVIGGADLHKADPTGSSALLIVSGALDSSGLLLTVVSCAVFLTALATVADVTLAAATSVTRDLLVHAVLKGKVPARRQELWARCAATLIGAVAVVLAVVATDWNLLVLSTLALTTAASALAPVLIYGLLWPRFTKTGALWCLYGSTVLVTVLVTVSPLISGGPAAIFPARDFDWMPLVNPGLVTIPAGFAFGWLGSVLGRRGSASAAARYADLELAAIVGRRAD